MASRLELHEKLCERLETRNCYFQPPESVKMSYPCIVYHLEGMETIRANDGLYLQVPKYGLTYITKNPDDPLIHQIEGRFRMCKMGKPYIADNLHHYPYVLYDI